MALETLPDWFLLAIAIAGIIGGISMFVRWFTRTIKTTWESNGKAAAAPTTDGGIRACPMDSGFVTSQLTSCETSREQAAVRDQQMLTLLQQILAELQGIRSQQQEILKGITILLERNR